MNLIFSGSDLFNSRRTQTYSNPANYGTSKPLNSSPTPNLADLGEYRQCLERLGNTDADERSTSPSQNAIRYFMDGELS